MTDSGKSKSAIVAGMLGIFFGAVGAQDWYLGRKGRAKLELGLFFGAILVLNIFNNFLRGLIGEMPVVFYNLINIPAFFVVFLVPLWGVIDGIMIIANGNVGLVRRGIKAKIMPQELSLPPARDEKVYMVLTALMIIVAIVMKGFTAGWLTIMMFVAIYFYYILLGIAGNKFAKLVNKNALGYILFFIENLAAIGFSCFFVDYLDRPGAVMLFKTLDLQTSVNISVACFFVSLACAVGMLVYCWRRRKKMIIEMGKN